MPKRTGALVDFSQEYIEHSRERKQEDQLNSAIVPEMSQGHKVKGHPSNGDMAIKT